MWHKDRQLNAGLCVLSYYDVQRANHRYLDAIFDDSLRFLKMPVEVADEGSLQYLAGQPIQGLHRLRPADYLPQ